LGPTLALETAKATLEAVYLPPVRQGDVYRLVRLGKPRVIAIVDGYFNQVPAVWHKEILWAMSAGIPVYGAASMGALRAAELAAFGMHGVGRVFEAFRDGVLPPYGGEPFEDDDEVAVLHGPPETGYISLSDAMVNIRCSLAAASAAGIITRHTRDELVQLAKRTFYAERNYQRLLAMAAKTDLPADQIAALRNWLPKAGNDQKRDDTLELLRVVGNAIADGVDSINVEYSFQHTTQWEAAVSAIEAEEPARVPVLDELRLEGEPYFECRRAVLGRLLAVHTASQGPSLSEALREALGMPSENGLGEALHRHHGQPLAIDEMWRHERCLGQLREAVATLPQGLFERHLRKLLEESGDYARLQSRARQKQDVIEASPGYPGDTDLSVLRELQLHDWYFEQRLGREMPEDVPGYAADLGFSDMGDFNQALIQEYVFLQASKSNR
jgi:hypothetical protein